MHWPNLGLLQNIKANLLTFECGTFSQRWKHLAAHQSPDGCQSVWPWFPQTLGHSWDWCRLCSAPEWTLSSRTSQYKVSGFKDSFSVDQVAMSSPRRRSRTPEQCPWWSSGPPLRPRPPAGWWWGSGWLWIFPESCTPACASKSKWRSFSSKIYMFCFCKKVFCQLCNVFFLLESQKT